MTSDEPAPTMRSAIWRGFTLGLRQTFLGGMYITPSRNALYQIGYHDAVCDIVALIDARIDEGRGIAECYNEARTLAMVKSAIRSLPVRADHTENTHDSSESSRSGRKA